MYICILLHVDLTSQYILHITSICSCNSNVVNCTDQNSPGILDPDPVLFCVYQGLNRDRYDIPNIMLIHKMYTGF